jgi:Flp pilus assembly protein TadD
MRTYLMPSLALILCSACASTPAPDPANPYQLNEEAARQVQAGRLDAAEILLERAVLIAPHEATIRTNRDALRDYRSGRVETVAPLPSASTANPAPRDKAAEEPELPLWPARK